MAAIQPPTGDDRQGGALRRVVLPLALLALVFALFRLGPGLRQSLGLQLSVASLQDRVATLGWLGPAAFVGAVVFRQFLLLPSAVVLAAGGLCFGVLPATVLGAGGIVCSALMNFGIARGVRGAWRRADATAPRARRGRLGALLVALATAYPVGPMSWVHWAAGASSLGLGAFLVAVVVAAPLRAFAYAFFGSSLDDPGTGRLVVAAVLLLAAILVPLALPGVRRRLRGLNAE